MQYYMLIYLDAQRWSDLSTDERNQIHRECGEWHQALVKSGHTRNCAGLQSPSTATTRSVASRSG